MIRADLRDGAILVASDELSAPIVAKLAGATRTARMPPLTWRMPLTLDSVAMLRGASARASPALIAEAKRMLAIQKYIDEQKQTAAAEPLAPIPVNDGCKLFDHQVRAFNIALALMGYETE